MLNYFTIKDTVQFWLKDYADGIRVTNVNNNVCKNLLCFFEYRKTCIFASLFLRAIINIFIQVIFPNIITYLDRTFKEEQNDINFKMK